MDFDGVLLIKSELKGLRDDLLRDFQDCLDSLRQEHERALREQRVQLQHVLHCCCRAEAEELNQSAGVPEQPVDVAMTDENLCNLTAHDSSAQRESETTMSPKATQSSRASAQRFFAGQGEAGGEMHHTGSEGAFGDLRCSHSMSGFYEESTRPDFLKKAGTWQAIARNEVFHNITLAIILTNAMYLGVDLELNDEDFLWFANWPFIVAENLLCAFYVFEWVIRFQAFERKHNCLRDRWFKFDTLLMVLTVMETWITGLFFLMTKSSQSLPTAPLRLMRLLRLGRLVRLVRGSHELITIVRGLMIAARACVATMAMIFLTNFAGSIFMYTVVKHERRLVTWFNTLSGTMWTLFLDGTLMCNTGDVYHAFLECDGIDAWGIGLMIFFCCQCITHFMLLNLLTGILCEVVTTVATEEKDAAAMKMLQKTVMKSLISHDSDLSGYISGEELMSTLLSKEAGQALRSLGIDLDYVLEVAQIMLSHDEVEVPVRRMMHMILSCRGDQPATVSSTSFAARLTHLYMETILDRLHVPRNQRPTRRPSGSSSASDDPPYPVLLAVSQSPVKQSI